MGFEIVFSPVFIRFLFRRLLIGGYTKEEAGNLIAGLMGLATAKNGWTPKELVSTLFLSEIHNKITS